MYATESLGFTGTWNTRQLTGRLKNENGEAVMGQITNTYQGTAIGREAEAVAQRLQEYNGMNEENARVAGYITALGKSGDYRDQQNLRSLLGTATGMNFSPMSDPDQNKGIAGNVQNASEQGLRNEAQLKERALNAEKSVPKEQQAIADKLGSAPNSIDRAEGTVRRASVEFTAGNKQTPGVLGNQSRLNENHNAKDIIKARENLKGLPQDVAAIPRSFFKTQQDAVARCVKAGLTDGQTMYMSRRLMGAYGGLKNAGYVVDEALKNSYEAYLKTEKERLSKDKKEWFMPDTRPAEMAVSAQVIREQAAKADVALVTLGRTSGEFLDRMVADFNLTKEEQNMLKAVSDAFHAAGKKVVVVLNIGGVIETASWKSVPDAILCAWQAGQEGGNSVADVLSGKASPSGKLTMTFPVKFEDAASSDNFPIDMRVSTDLMNKGGKKNDVKNVDYTNYEEDIYVGYRYFDTFGKQVSYPFGYGLSYTTFAYDKAAVKADNGVYTVSVEVKNTGKVAGKEVVQLYVSAPDAAANKPEKELKAFAKTKELKPGEAVVVTLKVNAADMASYDEAASAWVVTPGNYKFLVGASSRDIKATLEAEVAAATQKTNNILKLQEPMSLLKR